MSNVGSPQIEEVKRVDIAESDGREWVEVFMQVNQCGDMAEPFMVEWFPSENSCMDRHSLNKFNTRVINPDVFEEDKQKEYQLFAAIIGRLTLHEPIKADTTTE
jgi:hypothetical protein